MANTKKETLVLPELDDKAMEKLHEAGRTIYAKLKREGTIKASDEDVLDSAVVLAIFAVFNPKNIPMPEAQIEEVFGAYKEWIGKKVFN